MSRVRRRIKLVVAVGVAALAFGVFAAGAQANGVVSYSAGVLTITSDVETTNGCDMDAEVGVTGGDYDITLGSVCAPAEWQIGTNQDNTCDPSGDGTSQVICESEPVTSLVINTSANDEGSTWNIGFSSNDPVTFTGNDDFDNVIDGGATGLSQADNINGGLGDDDLEGGEGADTVTGGADQDTIDGGPGADTLLNGGPDGATSTEDDTIHGGTENDTISGDDDTDDLFGDAGADTINGGADADTIEGGADADPSLNGDAGADTIRGDAGIDTLNGGTEADDLFGGTEGDTLNGGTGNDDLNGEAGADGLNGDDGNDDLTGGADADELDGGEAAETTGDTAIYDDKGADVTADIGGNNNDGNATDGVSATARDDIHTDVENITGGAGNDTLTGDTGANILTGNGGGDTMRGSAASTVADGADVFTGSAGDDRVTYGTRDDDLVIDADGVADDGAAAEADNLGPTVEDISGGDGDDDIIGTAAVLAVGEDRDIDGGAGDDDLQSSTATGADGADEFTGGTNGTAGGQNGTLGDTVSYIDRTTAIDVDIDGDDDDGAGGCPAGAGCEDDDVHVDVENVTGGDGSDVLIGSSAANRLLGGNGGSDSLAGGPGTGPDGADLFSGGQHVVGTVDEVTYETRTDNITADIDDVADDGAGEGDNLLNQIENITGGLGNDTLTGLGADNDLRGGPGTGNDVLTGGNGDDILRGGDVSTPTGPDGTDTYIGGEGTENDGGDLVTFGPRDDNLVIDIGGGADDPDGDNIGTDVENLQGGDGDDTITGDNQNNELIGDVGSDLLAGGAGDAPDGDDILDGRSQAGTSDTVSYAHRTADSFIDFESGTAAVGSDPDTDTLLNNENAVGGGGDDTLVGNDLDNVLDGGPGNDFLNGGFVDTDEADGADTYIGGESGEDGDGDYVNYGHRAAAVTADIGAGLDQEGDEIRNDVENLIGGTAGDTLGGNGHANLIEGLEGGDTMTGGGGVDSVTGGSGGDTFNVRDGNTDNVDCGPDPDTVNGDQAPAEALFSAPACETQNLANPAQADLSLTMTVDNPNPGVGQQVAFTLTLSASANATGVTVADVLPAGLTYVSDSPGAPYDQATGVWNAGTVLATTPEAISIVATKAAAGPIQNAAEIATSNALDPDSTPNNGAPGEDDLAAVTLADAVPPPPPPTGGGATTTAVPPTTATAPKKCKKGFKLKKGKCKKKKKKK